MIENDAELAEYFSALANANRLAVLRALAEGEACVKDLAARVNLSQTALSQHLSVLKSQQLVKSRRESQKTYYSLTNHRSEKALSLVNDILFPNGVQLSMFGFSEADLDAA